MDKNNKTQLYVSYKRLTSLLRTHIGSKWRDGKKIFHANGNKKTAGIAIFISDTIDPKSKTVKRNKGHYIMIKGSIHPEDITSVNIYAPTIRAPECIKKNLTHLKGEIDNNTNIVGDFNTVL